MSSSSTIVDEGASRIDEFFASTTTNPLFPLFVDFLRENLKEPLSTDSLSESQLSLAHIEFNKEINKALTSITFPYIQHIVNGFSFLPDKNGIDARKKFSLHLREKLDIVDSLGLSSLVQEEESSLGKEKEKEKEESSLGKEKEKEKVLFPINENTEYLNFLLNVVSNEWKSDDIVSPVDLIGVQQSTGIRSEFLTTMTSGINAFGNEFKNARKLLFGTIDNPIYGDVLERLRTVTTREKLSSEKITDTESFKIFFKEDSVIQKSIDKIGNALEDDGVLFHLFVFNEKFKTSVTNARDHLTNPQTKPSLSSLLIESKSLETILLTYIQWIRSYLLILTRVRNDIVQNSNKNNDNSFRIILLDVFLDKFREWREDVDLVNPTASLFVIHKIFENSPYYWPSDDFYMRTSTLLDKEVLIPSEIEKSSETTESKTKLDILVEQQQRESRLRSNALLQIRERERDLMESVENRIEQMVNKIESQQQQLESIVDSYANAEEGSIFVERTEKYDESLNNLIRDINKTKVSIFTDLEKIESTLENEISQRKILRDGDIKQYITDLKEKILEKQRKIDQIDQTRLEKLVLRDNDRLKALLKKNMETLESDFNLENEKLLELLRMKVDAEDEFVERRSELDDIFSELNRIENTSIATVPIRPPKKKKFLNNISSNTLKLKSLVRRLQKYKETEVFNLSEPDKEIGCFVTTQDGFVSYFIVPEVEANDAWIFVQTRERGPYELLDPKVHPYRELKLSEPNNTVAFVFDQEVSEFMNGERVAILGGASRIFKLSKIELNIQPAPLENLRVSVQKKEDSSTSLEFFDKNNEKLNKSKSQTEVYWRYKLPEENLDTRQFTKIDAISLQEKFTPFGLDTGEKFSRVDSTPFVLPLSNNTVIFVRVSITEQTLNEIRAQPQSQIQLIELSKEEEVNPASVANVLDDDNTNVSQELFGTKQDTDLVVHDFTLKNRKKYQDGKSADVEQKGAFQNFFNSISSTVTNLVKDDDEGIEHLNNNW